MTSTPRPSRNTAERVLQIIFPVIDRIIGAVLFGERQFFVRGCAGDDAGIHQLAKFDCRETRTAGGTKDGQSFAGTQFRAVLQRVKRCAIGDAKAGCPVKIKCIRYLDELAGRRCNFFTCCAMGETADDAIADLHRTHVRTDAFDRAGKFRGR